METVWLSLVDCCARFVSWVLDFIDLYNNSCYTLSVPLSMNPTKFSQKLPTLERFEDPTHCFFKANWRVLKYESFHLHISQRPTTVSSCIQCSTWLLFSLRQIVVIAEDYSLDSNFLCHFLSWDRKWNLQMILTLFFLLIWQVDLQFMVWLRNAC